MDTGSAPTPPTSTTPTRDLPASGTPRGLRGWSLVSTVFAVLFVAVLVGGGVSSSVAAPATQDIAPLPHGGAALPTLSNERASTGASASARGAASLHSSSRSSSSRSTGPAAAALAQSSGDRNVAPGRSTPSVTSSSSHPSSSRTPAPSASSWDVPTTSSTSKDAATSTASHPTSAAVPGSTSSVGEAGTVESSLGGSPLCSGSGYATISVPQDNLLVYPNICDDEVEFIDMGDLQAVGSTAVGCLGNVVYDPTTGLVFAIDNCYNTLVGIDPLTYQIVTTWSSYTSCLDTLGDATTNGTGTLMVFSGCDDIVVLVNSVTGGYLGEVYGYAMGGPTIFDPANGEIYVASENPNVVYIYSLQTLAATPASGEVTGCLGPGLLIPSNDYVFVGGSNCGTISEIDPADNSVVYAAFSQTCPGYPAYSPISGDVYVPDNCNSNVGVFDPLTNTVVNTIPVSSCPTSAVADEYAPGDLYVFNDCTTSIDTITLGGLSTTSWGTAGSGVEEASTFDPTTDGIVGPLNVGTTTELASYNPASNVTTLSPLPYLACPNEIAYDAADLALWLSQTCTGGGNVLSVYEVSDSNDSVEGWLDLSTYGVECITSMADDAPNGTLFISDECTDTIWAVDTSWGPTPVSSFATGVCPADLQVDAADNLLYALTCQGDIDEFDIGDGYLTSSWVGDPVNNCPYTLSIDVGQQLALVSDACSQDVIGSSISTGSILWTLPTSESCAASTAFDPVDGNFYVADDCSNIVQVVNPTYGAIVGTDFLTGVPITYNYVSALTYDPNLGSVFATLTSYEDYGSWLFELASSGGSLTTQSFSSGLCDGYADAFDTANGLLYVANACTGDLEAIDPSTGATLYIPNAVGPCPGTMLYDAQLQEILLGDWCEGLVFVTDAQTNVFLTALNFDADSTPYLGLDASNGMLFVADYYGGEVFGLSAATGAVDWVDDFGEACPSGVAFDPATSDVYVTLQCEEDDLVQISLSGAILDEVDNEYFGCPYGALLDPALGEILVADECSGYVIGFNPVDLAQDSLTYVQDDPWAVVYDPANGLVYSSNDYCDGCVDTENFGSYSALDVDSGTDLADFPVQYSGFGAYDPSNGEMLFASGSSVDVLSTELAVSPPSASVGNLAVSGPSISVPYTCSYIQEQVQIGNITVMGSDCSPDVVAVVTPTGADLGEAAVPGGFWVDSIVYDPFTGLVYAAMGSGVIAAFQVSSSGFTYLGDFGNYGCPYGFAVDGAGNLWISDECSNTLYEVDPLTGETLNSFGGLPGVSALVYDSGDGDVIGVQSNSPNEVFVVSASSSQVINEYDLPSSLGCADSATYADVEGGILVVEDQCSGELEAVSPTSGALFGVIDFGGCLANPTVDPVSLLVLSPDPCNGAVYVTSLLNGTSETLTSAATPCPDDADLDAATGTWWVFDECYFTLTPYEFTPVGANPTTSADVGQLIQITSDLWAPGAGAVTATVGPQPRTNVVGLQCGVAVATPDTPTGTERAVCAAWDPGNYTVWLNTTDADGNEVSSWTTIEVFSQPLVVTPTASATSGDVGQSVVFSASARGGSQPYTYAWSGLPTGCTTFATSPDVSCVLGAVSGTTVDDVEVQVTDATGQSTAWSAPLVFTVDPDPTVSAISASTPSQASATFADAGDSVTFGATITSATAASLVWSGLPAACGSPSTSPFTCVVNVPGNYPIVLTVTDANGFSVSSPKFDFGVFPALSAGAPASSLSSGDVGQSVVLTAAVSGGAGGDAYVWSLGLSSCTGATSAVVTCSLRAADVGSHTVSYTVRDAAGDSVTSGTLSFAVYADPTVTTPSSSALGGDVGQFVTFSTSATGGTGSYASYTWSGLPGDCSGTSSATVSCELTTAGSFSITVLVTDSNGISSVASSALAFTVDAPPTAAAPTASSVGTDVGASGTVTFSGSASGGSAPYSYTWVGLPTGCTGLTTAMASCPGSAFVLPGELSVSYEVTDANGFSVSSATLAFAVDPALAVTTPTSQVAGVASDAADVGQEVLLNVSASGGSGSYVFAWTGLSGAQCAGASGAVVTCDFTSAGTYTVGVTVTDSLGVSTTSSGTLTLTISGAPSSSSATLTATPNALDEGQSLKLVAAMSGGSGGWSFAWSGLPTGCSGTTDTISCTPTATGIFVISFVATDANGISVDGPSTTVVVNAPLSVSAAASASAVTTGAGVLFGASASGGTGPITYSWNFGDSTTGSGATLSHSFSAAGTYTVTVTATDATGATATATVTVVVSATPSAASTFLGTSGSASYVAIAALVLGLLALLLAGLLLLRRNAGGPTTKPTGGLEGSGSSTTAPSPTPEAEGSEDETPSPSSP